MMLESSAKSKIQSTTEENLHDVLLWIIFIESGDTDLLGIRLAQSIVPGLFRIAGLKK
jgi:hypothetical protein